jgi:3-dehydroquinate dehydratase-2
VIVGDRPRILVVHGANLNLLGEREPEIYGTGTLAELVEEIGLAAAEHGFEIDAVQSNHEGVLIDEIHQARGRCAAIIINPGAFTHYAWGLHDALATFVGPIVEVHLSHPDRREPWRRHSVVAPVASGSISGFGFHGYRLAIEAIAESLSGAGSG